MRTTILRRYWEGRPLPELHGSDRNRSADLVSLHLQLTVRVSRRTDLVRTRFQEPVHATKVVSARLECDFHPASRRDRVARQ